MDDWAGTPAVEYPEAATYLPCVPRELPRDLLIRAAELAVKENPANDPLPRFAGRAGQAALDAVVRAAGGDEPLGLALVTGKRWPAGRKLSVSWDYILPLDRRIKDRVLGHCNAWHKEAGANVEFVPTSGKGEVRIGFDPTGYWSYVGTDVLVAPTTATMNLQGFNTLDKPEKEHRRVTRHEAGHTLGFTHEHLREELIARLDEQKTLAYMRRLTGWDDATIRRNVLTPAPPGSITASAGPDEVSVMCYEIPGEVTKDGRPIPGGQDLSPTDRRFARELYPGAPPPGGPTEAAWVARVYRELLDRDPQQPEVDNWLAFLRSGSGPSRRAEAASLISNSQEGRRNAVARYYRRLLAREPDPGGLQHWLTVLNLGAPQHEVAAHLMGSDEFFNRG